MSQRFEFTIFDRSFSIPVYQVLLALVALGALLRFFHVSTAGMWLDELHSMNGAHPAKTLSEVYEYSKSDQPPLLFFLLNGWFKVFGYNDFAGRSFTAFIGVLGIVAMYFTGRKYGNVSIGLMAAFITAINYFHIDMSREVRFYPLVFLLSALSYLYFLRAAKQEKILDFFLYSIFTGLLLNTHYFGLVVFGSQFLLLIIIMVFYKTKASLLIKGLAAGVVAGLTVIHWIPNYLTDIQVTNFHAPMVPFYFPVLFVWVYFKDIATCLIFSFSALLFVLHLWKQRKEKLELEQTIALGWLLFGFVIPLLYSILRMPLLTFKYSIITLPAIFLIFSYGFLKIKPIAVRATLVIVLLIGFLVNAIFIKKLYTTPPVEEWKEASAYVVKETRPRQVVFAKYAWYYSYYFRVFGYTQVLPFEQKYCDFENLVKNSDAVWLIVRTRYPDEGFSEDQNKYVLEQFNVASITEFKDAKATLYLRK